MGAQEAERVMDSGEVIASKPLLTLVPGVELGLQPTVTLEDPLPGLIELAPEFPVAPTIVPRHLPGEIAAWVARKAAGQRAAGRRISEHHHTDTDIGEHPKASVTPRERYTRGMGTRPSAKEISSALGVLELHNMVVHPKNKRGFNFSV